MTFGLYYNYVWYNIRKENLASFSKYLENKVVLKEKLPADFLKRLLKCMLKSNFIDLNIEKELTTIKNQL
jgi:hypothetical protein